MKRILFVTATRADYGKLKSLIRVIHESVPGKGHDLEAVVFATGMHLRHVYGYTYGEIKKDFPDIPTVLHETRRDPLCRALETMQGMQLAMQKWEPDMVVIHGDRIEALAAAFSASIEGNTIVGHVEGGEVSGTLDEALRHSTSMLSHVHFTANPSCSQKLVEMGENPDSIFVIGSPDIDVMKGYLPTMREVREKYLDPAPIPEDYGIIMYHPVTSETEEENRKAVKQVLRASADWPEHGWVMVYPNDDLHSEAILEEMKKYERKYENHVLFPSMRFEYFLTLLKNAKVVVGNSSVGIREAPVYGVPTVNVGTRQAMRWESESILDCLPKRQAVSAAIDTLWQRRFPPSTFWGDGRSSVRFVELLKGDRVWLTPIQKGPTAEHLLKLG